MGSAQRAGATGGERAEQEKARVERLKLFSEAVRLEPRGLQVEEKQQRGEPLSFFERAELDRWQQIRGCLLGHTLGAQSVRIERILHGARDIEGEFGEKEGE